MKSFRWFNFLFALFAGLLGGNALRAEGPSYGLAADNHIFAQQLVTEIMAANPGLLAAGLHCIPPGGAKQVIVASTLNVIGKPSDPEDVLNGGTTIVPSRKAPKLGIMLPLLDSAGTEIGSLALQFKYQTGEDQVKYLAAATAIREHTAKRVPSLAALFKPTP